MYSIVLFYKYTATAFPKELKLEQETLCKKLNLTGRMIIAEEGINATLGGMTEAIKSYVTEMKKNERFKDIDFKISSGLENAFPRLSIKIRPEIVTLGKNPKARGMHITPQMLHVWYEEKKIGKKDFTVIDMRNDYEHAGGLFEESIPAPIHRFRELNTVLPQLANLKNKIVVTVCTGGIRCEKASGYLLENGFTDVYQLHGGIHRYIEAFPEGYFKGALYVFDGRIVMKPNKNGEVIGMCIRCKAPSETYVNCANLECHLHFICCEKCGKEGEAFCDLKCQDIQSKRKGL